MSVTIAIPDFTYSAHFYPEILEDLTLYMRQNCPELTDEDPVEPHIQLIRAFSLGFHLNAVLLDMVANEMFLATAKLRASVKALLRLIDVQLAQASPASVDLIAQLSQTFAVARTIAIAGNTFGTAETRAAQAVEFELLDDSSTTDRTDQVSAVYAYDADTEGYADHTAQAITAIGTFSPTGWDPGTADALYIGHRGILWNQLDLVIGTPAADLEGVWEYFDGNFNQDEPSSVTNLGSTLRFNVNSILGDVDRSGTIVRVRSAVTGAFQDLVSTWAGGENRITTTGAEAFLGQSVPSTVESDYIVGSEWKELPDVVDNTSNLEASGTVTFTLPQSLENNWRKTTVGVGVLAVEAYWIRYRIISVGGGASTPAITQIRLDLDKQYILFNVTQGTTRTEDPLGSSDATASQEFTLANFPVIDDDNIAITVDESGIDQTYTRVDNFLNSVATDRHYRIDFDDDGGGIITFGDGTNGRIPPAGVNNITAVYRTMDEVNGNVGANSITVNRSGLAFLANVTNPRSADGFDVREGSTDDDLARVKIEGPASLRTGGRAVSPTDVSIEAKRFIAADGSKPVTRALAIEEAFGPKTIENVVVGSGGGQVAADKLSEIDDHFNGTEDEPGILLMNQELTSTNFIAEVVAVTVTLTGGSELAVVTALAALLNPLALKQDGTYAWEFGGLVTIAQLYQTIMNTTPPPTNALITLPVADITLGQRELPTRGTITINGNAY